MNKKSFYLFVIIFLAIAAVIFIFWFNKGGDQKVPTDTYSTPTVSTSELKTFKSSKVMDFTINYPKKYSVRDELDTVELSFDKGKIFIVQNATDYENLYGFLQDPNNNLISRLGDKMELNINGLEAVRGVVDDERTYYLYSNYNVYIIFTKTPDLYSDLDQIAQSFQYTPD